MNGDIKLGLAMVLTSLILVLAMFICMDVKKLLAARERDRLQKQTRYY